MKTPPVVLVIDDDRIVHEFLGEVIPSITGCRTLHAMTLREAEKLLSQDPPVLILIDGTLPDGKAQDWVKTLAKDPKWLSIPKWILSGCRPPGWKEGDGRPYGVEGFLLKPVSLDRLVAIIKETTEGPRAVL